jgi:hypothetical protein
VCARVARPMWSRGPSASPLAVRMPTEADLVKVFVDLPNHWDSKGESMWARPLGNDLYEIHNSPFAAYDLNYLDVVLAFAERADLKPKVQGIERRSGHRTLRIIFKTPADRSERDRLLAQLNTLGATYENSNSRQYALDIPPDRNYQAVCDQLWEWEGLGLLEYETCEARVPGSFDDVPRYS